MFFEKLKSLSRSPLRDRLFFQLLRRQIVEQPKLKKYPMIEKPKSALSPSLFAAPQFWQFN
jgi:hypothetical protein